MTALLGACLLLAGTCGCGICICMERKMRIRQLEALQQAFGIVAGEIAYSRISLPEIFAETGEKMKRAGEKQTGEVFDKIGSRLCDGNGRPLAVIWKEEMEPFLEGTKLSRTERQMVRSFPAAVCFPDGGRQQEAVSAFAKSIQKAAADCRTKQREENRITMAVSITCGVMLAILLV